MGLQLIGKGRGVLRRHAVARPAVDQGAEQGHWVAASAGQVFQQVGRRGLAVGARHPDQGKALTGLLPELRGQQTRPAALFGTLINRWPGHSVTAQHTTAFADELQAQLAMAAEAGSRIAAMEVSSHALDQQRISGCRFAGAIFTNLTQDHLDYHPSMEEYFEAKAKLFEAPLLGPDARAVVNVDDPWGARLAERLGERCWRASLDSNSAAELRMEGLQMGPQGVSGTLITPLGQGAFASPLLGKFNLMNLLEAVGVLLQQGLPLAAMLEALGSFKGVPGRMERVEVARVECCDAGLPAVLVDYAHTPDGLESALTACRPFVQGELICVFGCGGDRDRTKRPQMAAIAARLADQVLVTSDNPRTEDPEQILKDVVAGIPEGTPLRVDVDRAQAIAEAIAKAQPQDLVLIAGKGHEDYQILGTTKVHFDDREEAEKALRNRPC